MPTIDHDPKEPSHRAVKIMGVITAIITLAIIIPFGYGVRSFVEGLPVPVMSLLFGIICGLCAGYWVGWWDCERFSRTKGKDG